MGFSKANQMSNRRVCTVECLVLCSKFDVLVKTIFLMINLAIFTPSCSDFFTIKIFYKDVYNMIFASLSGLEERPDKVHFYGFPFLS